MSNASLPSGLRTPTSHGFMPLPLGTPGAGQPTTGVTVGDQVGASGAIGFGLHEPPKMRKAMSQLKVPTTGSKTPSEGSPPDTSGIDSASMNSMTSSNGSGQHSSPRGTLNVRLISGRGLAVSHSPNVQPQPYVVMQFEQNEFVSRAPHPVSSHTSVPFTTSTAQPVAGAGGQPGNLTRSASGLGVGTITRAFAEAVGRGKGKREADGSGAQTPRAEEPSGGGSWLGKPGPGDPVWKEEVQLWVYYHTVPHDLANHSVTSRPRLLLCMSPYTIAARKERASWACLTSSLFSRTATCMIAGTSLAQGVKNM